MLYKVKRFLKMNAEEKLAKINEQNRLRNQRYLAKGDNYEKHVERLRIYNATDEAKAKRREYARMYYHRKRLEKAAISSIPTI